MGCHYQEAEIAHKNTCALSAKVGLKVSLSKWETPTRAAVNDKSETGDG